MNCFSPISFALFGDIGGGEILVVLAAILVLFGGQGFPSMARTLGKLMSDIQRLSQDFKNQLLDADRDPVAPPPPQLTQETTSTEPYDSEAPKPETKPATEPPPHDHAG